MTRIKEALTQRLVMASLDQQTEAAQLQNFSKTLQVQSCTIHSRRVNVVISKQMNAFRMN